MYAASQAGVHAISPYVEALLAPDGIKWLRVVSMTWDFPLAVRPGTMTADLTGKLPRGTSENSHHY